MMIKILLRLMSLAVILPALVAYLPLAHAEEQSKFWGELLWDRFAISEGENSTRYGNWFGPGWWGGSELPDRVGPLPPIDALDAVAQKHDFGYAIAEELGKNNPRLEYYYKAMADVIAARDAQALDKDPSRWTPPASNPASAARYRDRIVTGFKTYYSKYSEILSLKSRPADYDGLDSRISERLDEKQFEAKMNERLAAWNKEYLDLDSAYQQKRKKLNEVPEKIATNTGGSCDQVIVDNGNTAACDTTQTAIFNLQSETTVNTISIWYNTQIGGLNLPFTLQGSKTQSSGTLQTKGCDSNQSQWCEGQISINASLPAGQYTLTTATPAVCQNSGSGGNGFVKVKGCNCVPGTKPFQDGTCVSIKHSVSTNPENKNDDLNTNEVMDILKKKK